MNQRLIVSSALASGLALGLVGQAKVDNAADEWKYVAKGTCKRMKGLPLLGTHDPAGLRLSLAPGTALVVSPHPVVAIWQAHRAGPGDADVDRFAAVRAAFAARFGEAALVARQGWQPVVRALAAPEARCTAAVLAGTTLASTLASTLHAGRAELDFGAWLHAALRQGLLAAVSAARAAPTWPPAPV